MMGSLRRSKYPLSFETLNQNSGYLLYETEIPFDGKETYLEIPRVKDFANVYVNGIFLGNLSREFMTTKLQLPSVKSGDKLSIVVENLGRINYGALLNDTKGILSNVYLDGRILTRWNMTTYELKDTNVIEYCFFASRTEENCLEVGGYTFYVGSFRVPVTEGNDTQSYPLDSFLDVSQLTKGVVFINDYNLGRYWSTRGPQYTLYVPGVYLKSNQEDNIIVIMDEYISVPSITVKFSKKPNFNYGRV